MSVEAMVAVMNYSQQVWGEKLLMLLIANQANWPEALAEISEADLAFEAGRTPRHLRTSLRKIEETGELICHRQPGRKSIFEIPQLPGEPDRREAIARKKDARKRSYDDRLDRLRADRTRPDQPDQPDQPDEPDPVDPPAAAPATGKRATKEHAQRDWRGLKRRMAQAEPEPEQEQEQEQES